MYERILYEVDEGIATVTLNRPEKLNAYTPQMGEEIVDAFGRARADAAARVVILTGAGRGFCAGVDLDYMKAAFAGKAPAGAPKLGEEAFVRQWPIDLLDFPKGFDRARAGLVSEFVHAPIRDEVLAQRVEITRRQDPTGRNRPRAEAGERPRQSFGGFGPGGSTG